MTGAGVADRRPLEPRPNSVGHARRIVREVLARAGRGDLQYAGELIVSELVTNALLHAGTAIVLSIHASADGVLVEVADGSAHLPAERGYAALAGTGRGLALVHQLCQSWGARPTSTGKSVWAWLTADGPERPVPLGAPHQAESAAHGPTELVHELVATDAAPRRPGDGGPPVEASARTLAVELRNVPLLMHLAWHQHAEALMREYLLARLEVDEVTALQEHAMASDAMALLYDQVPAPLLPGGVQGLEDVEELLTSVVEPAPTLAAGWLTVPVTSLAHFQTLNEVIEHAVALAEMGALLAVPVQPELRELRRWICGEVTEQSHGAEPRPWSSPTAAPPPGSPMSRATWDSAPVDRSGNAVVAADDTNRIIAVSGPALDLLGYDDAAQLVGQRLLALIPPRFHQAHLAGFTMFLTSGRRPLLDTEVVVPFVRADATEVPLRLRVEVIAVGGEQRVFVAELGSPNPTV